MDTNTTKKGVWGKIPDSVKAGFFRWWLAGAVYFFIAWGTNLGMKEDPIDLIFILGLITGIAHIFIFNPIVFGMFDVQRNGKIINKKYYERTIFENVFLNLAEILKCIVITCLVVACYELLNSIILSATNSTGGVPIKGEPFLYATFFILFYALFDLIRNFILKIIEKRKDTTNE